MGQLVKGFASVCSFVPYALVALALRLVMARVYFIDGQTRIDGVRLPLDLQGFDLSMVLPVQVRAETFAAFFTQYVALPLSPVLAAWLVSAAEFVLPVMLVLGLGMRFATLGLLIMTAMIQIYVLPQALWSTHGDWASMLMVLLALDPGCLSLDALVRAVSRRQTGKNSARETRPDHWNRHPSDHWHGISHRRQFLGTLGGDRHRNRAG